jgi:hypothetical protein
MNEIKEFIDTMSVETAWKIVRTVRLGERWGSVPGEDLPEWFQKLPERERLYELPTIYSKAVKVISEYTSDNRFILTRFSEISLMNG